MKKEFDIENLKRDEYVTVEHLGQTFKGKFYKSSEKSCLLHANGRINWYPKTCIKGYHVGALDLQLREKEAKAKKGFLPVGKEVKAWAAGKEEKNKARKNAEEQTQKAVERGLEVHKVFLDDLTEDEDFSKLGKAQKISKIDQAIEQAVQTYDTKEFGAPLKEKLTAGVYNGERATPTGELIISFLKMKHLNKSMPPQGIKLQDICDGIGKTRVSLIPVIDDLKRLGIAYAVTDGNYMLTILGLAYVTGSPREVTKVKMPAVPGGEVKKSNKEKVLAMYKHNQANGIIMTWANMARAIGCDVSYPGWIVKEEAKRLLKEKAAK